MKLGPEAIQCFIYYDWVRFHKLDGFIYHIANERRCSSFQGDTFKRMGVKPGVWDYDIKKACNGYHGLIIEMKIKPNKLTPLQVKYGETATQNGYLTAVCWSGDEAICKTIEYLNLDIIHPGIAHQDKLAG